MITEDNAAEQDRKLEEMDYNPGEDIFNKEEHIPLDGDGNPITNPAHVNDGMPYGLDIPGAEDDDNFEQITDQLPEEDADGYSIIDDEDDQFEDEVDLIDDMDNEDDLEDEDDFDDEENEDEIDN